MLRRPWRDALRWRAVLEHAVLGLVLVDRDAKLLHVNPAFARLFGRDAHELGGRDLFGALHADDRAPHRELFERLLRGELDTMLVEARVEATPSGEVPWVRGTLAAVRTDERSSFLGVFEALPPEQRRRRVEAVTVLEDALARETEARQAAEHVVGLNELFMGILGHDLRNPLGAILVGAQHLLRLGGSEAQLRTTKRIVSSAERMARMIEQLLDFTRIRAGRGLSMELGVTNLADLCTRSTEELEQAQPQARFACTTLGDPTGTWDPDRLAQVFSNLLGNAVHHGVLEYPIEVEIDGRKPDEVFLEIRNHGTIPASVLPTIFDPFRGSDRNDRRTHSLGLGLYITKQIVEGHGGHIEVNTSEEDGTMFRVQLPRGPGTARHVALP